MGAPLAQWLGRPSTICFLRRVLASTEDPFLDSSRIATRVRRRDGGRRIHTGTAPIHHGEQVDEEHERHRDRSPRSFRKYKGKVDDNHADRTALGISLKSGVNLLDKHTAPEEAFKALWRQTNVASPRRVGKLIVDRSEHRTNMKLWVELLDYRQRIDGFAGVVEIWSGMRYRKVDLPVSGDEADILWTTLLNACILADEQKAHKRLRDSILDYAKDLHQRCGAVWPKLYPYIVGRWLRIKPHMAWVAHKLLVEDHGMSNVPLADLVHDCIVSLKRGDARRAFHAVHQASGQRCLYDRFLPDITKNLDDREALRWHRDFIKIGDGPSPDVFALPAIQRLFALDGNKSLPMLHQTKMTRFKMFGDGDKYLPLTRANMSTLVGEVHGIKPKNVSDIFVAKLFATRAFSLSLVIQGLGIFGVDRLGPLALHEMVLKAGTSVEFSNGLAELKSMGIAVDPSVYGRLLERVAHDGQTHLFQILMASDQHPEAYDDAPTQESLLVSFLEKGDMHSAHLTLLALSIAGHAEHIRAWNRVLQHYIQEQNYAAITKTMRYMQDSRMPPTMSTLNTINRYVLPPRAQGKAPAKAGLKARILRPLQFTTNAYMFAAQKKVYVRHSLWKEQLRRYAMTGEWDECERLVYWLLSWYGRHKSSRDPSGRRAHWYGMQTLRGVFPPVMQKALIHWGLRCAGHSKLLYRGATYSKTSGGAPAEECQPWARGLLLARKLNESGIPVARIDVRRALTIRLLPLFGPAYSVKPINEEARRHNHLTLADYIKHANEVWGENLFSVDTKLLSEDPPTYARLMIAIFSHQRRIGQKSKEYADIAAYAQAWAKQYRRPFATNGTDKTQQWRNSPFRLVRRIQAPPGPTPASLDDHNPHSRRSRQWPSARSSSSHPPPSPADTPGPS